MILPARYWYYGLVLLSLVLLAAALNHRRDWKLPVLHLIVFGIIQPFELFVLTTNGYVYLPGVFGTAIDNILGAIVSDFFIIPAVAVLLNALELSWYPAVGAAAIFTVIDWYFSLLDIYRHFWWKSIYTGIGLTILFMLSTRVWHGLKQHKAPRWFCLAVIYFTYFPLQALITFAFNQGGELFKLQAACLSFIDPFKAMLLILNAYQMLVGITVTLCLGLKLRLRQRVAGMAVIIVLNAIIADLGIFVPQTDITSQHLLFVPLAASLLVIWLFKAARLDYLLP